jgi:hypothetical protein
MEDYVEPVARRFVAISHTFGAVPDTEERIRHKLGRVPAGYRVVSQGAAGSVYRTAGATKDTRFHVHLRSSAAGLTVALEVF